MSYNKFIIPLVDSEAKWVSISWPFWLPLVAIRRPLPLHGSNKVDFVIRRLFVAVISVDGGHAHPREYHDDDYGNWKLRYVKFNIPFYGSMLE